MDFDYEEDSFIDYDDEDDEVFINQDNGDDSDDNDDDVDSGGAQNAVKEDLKKRGKERVVKMSFASLLKVRQKTLKTAFITTVRKMVIKNTEIAVRCGMILHHIVMNCVTSGIIDPPDFCSRKFIEASLNYNMSSTNGLLLAAKEAFGDDFAPEYEEMTGCGWLLGYLANTYIGNITSLTKGKWKAVINDSIEAYGIVYLRNASKQGRYRTKREIRRQIFMPGADRPNTAPNLDQEAINLVKFHRRGFRLRGNQILDKNYINNSIESFHYYILHYGHCLQRQERLERTWNDSHPPSQSIGLKKRLPLPFFKREQCKSVKIDKRGLYYILSEYRKAVRINTPDFQFPSMAPVFPTVEKKFTDIMYSNWMNFLFRIDKVLGKTKIFKSCGVGIITNGVSASVLFFSPRPPNPEEDEALLQSIQQLSMNPLNDDDISTVIDEDCNNDGDDETIGDDFSTVYIHDGTV